MTRVVITQNNPTPPFWHLVNFLGPNKSESRGVVDLLAIRKYHADPGGELKRGDLFEIVLIQVKGGNAPWPTAEDRKRLRLVKRTHRAKAVILSEWKKGHQPVFYKLKGDRWVLLTDIAEVFGKHSGQIRKRIRSS